MNTFNICFCFLVMNYFSYEISLNSTKRFFYIILELFVVVFLNSNTYFFYTFFNTDTHKHIQEKYTLTNTVLLIFQPLLLIYIHILRYMYKDFFIICFSLCYNICQNIFRKFGKIYIYIEYILFCFFFIFFEEKKQYPPKLYPPRQIPTEKQTQCFSATRTPARLKSD